MILQNLLFLINIFFNVEKCNRREETRQRNNLLKEKREICVISNTTDSRVLSTIESPNIKTRKELDNNAEELSLNCNEKTRTEIIKVANFEYEEEWNIGGIPELLNELDADIEKSLECIYDSQLDVIKNESNNEQGISKPLQQNYCEKKVASFNLNLSKSAPLLKIKINKNPLEKNSSTFTGFSNKGHLISNSTKSISLCSTTLFKNSAESKKGPKNLNLQKEQGCRISMPSQAGINDNTSSNISGTSINVSCSQNISCSNSSNKINSKMSTDHQATLDKGLKMKIKRTKPGTKTSEAKHEIVKATEQQPNGFVESGTIMSSTSQEDVTCLLSHPSVSSNSQSSNLTIGMNISQSNINLNGNKKNLGNVNNQNNIPSNVGGMSLTNSSSTTSNISQGLPQGTKRGSSVHRRDKTKDKSYHSTRTAIEKNISFANDKESFERPLCFCNCTDGNISTCSCVRKSENNTFAQRMPADNACGSVTVVPPGVFTPSTDTSMSEVISNLLAVTTAVSTTVCTQTLSSDANASIPGSSCKEVFINSSGNAKISSHIAAQLAAAASPNSSTNGSSCTTSSLFPNVEMKSSSSQVVKQLALSPSSTAVTLSVSNQKTLSVSSPTGAEKLTTISTLSSENTVSPPAKRLKHTDKNSASSSSSNKEMVDMCIGTSVGTITEPDCLGPCEPGTSVTLEGIVWHETESGVLVVNVTWRGKTYVGTLLDCTRHDWAPPRFCESPTDDMDTRTPKGRGKRNRTTITPDLSNFTETRSSIYFSHSHVHSKVRNGSNKGGRGTVRTTTSVPTGDKANSSSSLSSGNSGSTPTSPTSFLPPRVEKRKSKDESPPPNSTDTETAKSSTINASGKATSSSVTEGLSSQPQGLIKPLTGLSVQISAKKLKTSSCAISPVLFECPENYCSKKYKHVNGLRYHQTHAHGSTSLIDEDSMTEAEGYTMPQPCSHSSISIPVTPDDSDSTPNNLQSVSSQQLEGPMIEEFTAKEINTSEKCTSETVLSTLPLKDLLALTVPSNTASTTPDASEIIPSELIEQEQEKEQPHNLAESSGMNSLTSSDQTIEKSGVLRFANGESKNNIGLLPTDSVNESFVQMELLTASSPKKFISGLQESNNDAFHSESMDKQTIQPQNLLCIAANKTLPPVLLGAKSEKEKMSSISDYEVNKLNASNISSRGDVQSPAYSDISDDLSPVCEPIHIGKEDDSSTNPDLIKKSQNVSLSATTNCSSTQANISSAVGSYGVYQFYQQQQFIVPNMDEQQQSAKNAVSTNLGSPTNQPNHQQTILEFTTKKDPQIELISKGNLNQPLSNQNYQEINKDTTRTICISGSKGSGELSNVPSSGSSALNTAAPSKSISHFYAFNYVPTNFSINVDQNIENASSPIASEDKKKLNRLSEISNSNNQPQEQHSTIIHKDDQSTEQISSTESDKSAKLQIQSTQTTKHDAIEKSECTKQESACNNVFQAPHMPFSSKDHTNLFQRQSLTMSPQQLSREEELRRYYIFSDQQRRHNSSCHNAINLQIQNTSPLSGIQQCKDDISSSQQHTVNSQQQIKTKGTTNLSINKAGNAGNTSKESPKHKQDEDLKVIKQEGQKPTMESHGPPPPSTSQYFLHPSYITPSPFGFDPNHPMYRNVLMPVTSPYNTSPYHLPISRYHAPEDLSRNTGTKALDALHHAACQYYSTHKIHELSEKALKSPNDSNLSNASSSMKIAGSSPNNISATQLSNIASHGIGQHDVQNQHSSVAQLSHNINLQNIGITNKQEILGQKLPGNGLGITANPPIELSKPQTGVISSAASNCSIESGSCNNGNSVNSGNGSTSDARSPPPQRHVHTHHHTHVGLGYPMYPAPYGAAVLASQQAAAVAVINPFPPGPSK